MQFLFITVHYILHPTLHLVLPNKLKLLTFLQLTEQEKEEEKEKKGKGKRIGRR